MKKLLLVSFLALCAAGCHHPPYHGGRYPGNPPQGAHKPMPPSGASSGSASHRPTRPEGQSRPLVPRH